MFSPSLASSQCEYKPDSHLALSASLRVLILQRWGHSHHRSRWGRKRICWWSSAQLCWHQAPMFITAGKEVSLPRKMASIPNCHLASPTADGNLDNYLIYPISPQLGSWPCLSQCRSPAQCSPRVSCKHTFAGNKRPQHGLASTSFPAGGLVFLWRAKVS